MAFIKVNIVKHIREAGKIFDNGKYVIGEEIISINFRSKEKRGWGTQYILKTKTPDTTIKTK